MESFDSAKLSPDECFVLEPISKRAAYNVIGIYVLFVMYTVWRAYRHQLENGSLGSQLLILVLVVAGLAGLFAFYIADAYGAAIRIDSHAIEKIGLFDRRVRIPWNGMKKIKLSRGADYHGMPANASVLVTGKATFFHPNKFEFSANHTLYFERRGFWDAARQMVALAEKRGVEVKGLKGFF